MAIKFLEPINLTGLELQNVLVQNLVGTPATALGEGQIIYDSSSGVKSIKYWNGTTWITLDGLGTVVSLSGSVGSSITTTITGTATVPIINAALNNTSVTAGTYTSADITVDAQGRITAASSNGSGTVSSVTAGNGVVITGTPTVNPVVSVDYSSTGIIADAAAMSGAAASGDIILLSDISASGAVKRTTVGNVTLNVLGAPTADLSINTHKLTNVVDPTAAQDAATKSYVDTTFAGSGALIYQGGYDATTAAPSAGVKQGWTYAVTVAGTGSPAGFWNPKLEVGDLVIANVDTPTSAADWTEINKNIDVATATIQGIANFPTSGGLSVSAGAVSIPSSGVSAGTYGTANKVSTVTVNSKGITTGATETSISIPASAVINFCAEVESCVSSTSREKTGTIGNATSWLITHNMGTRNVMVQVYANASPWDTVNVSVERTSTNSVTLSVASNPGASAFSYMIQKIG